jgi:hypothetical protein
MPWAAVAGVVSALVSAWMIWQVHDIYSTRQKKRLEEIYSPKTPVSREQETPREFVKSPPALTELRYPSRYASSRRP